MNSFDLQKLLDLLLTEKCSLDEYQIQVKDNIKVIHIYTEPSLPDEMRKKIEDLLPGEWAVNYLPYKLRETSGVEGFTKENFKPSNFGKPLPHIQADPVSHPSHYNSGKIEVIEFIHDQGFGEGFDRGNAIKYIARAGKKPSSDVIEDLEKAVWYLQYEIETLKAKRENRDPVRPNDMRPRIVGMHPAHGAGFDIPLHSKEMFKKDVMR